jgi:hypothetical protein
LGVAEALDEGLDGLGLVACGWVWGLELEGHGGMCGVGWERKYNRLSEGSGQSVFWFCGWGGVRGRMWG